METNSFLCITYKGKLTKLRWYLFCTDDNVSGWFWSTVVFIFRVLFYSVLYVTLLTWGYHEVMIKLCVWLDLMMTYQHFDMSTPHIHHRNISLFLCILHQLNIQMPSHESTHHHQVVESLGIFQLDQQKEIFLWSKWGSKLFTHERASLWDSIPRLSNNSFHCPIIHNSQKGKYSTSQTIKRTVMPNKS